METQQAIIRILIKAKQNSHFPMKIRHKLENVDFVSGLFQYFDFYLSIGNFYMKAIADVETKQGKKHWLI